MRMRMWGAVVMLAAVPALSGCTFDTAGPPVLVIRDFRYIWEGDLLVANFTLENRGDFIIGTHESGASYPLISIAFDEYERTDAEGDKLVRKYWASNGMWLVDYPDSGGPKRRYYVEPSDNPAPNATKDGGFVGPLVIPPGKAISMEWAHRPRPFTDPEGYILVRVDAGLVAVVDGRNDEYGMRFAGGCINPQIYAFYGTRDGGPDCAVCTPAGELTMGGRGSCDPRNNPEATHTFEKANPAKVV